MEENEEIKSGRRNSSLDQKSLNAAHDALVAAGAVCPGGDVMKAEEAEPTQDAIKAQIEGVTEYHTPDIAIKTAGEMELDVCYMPYNGQHNGKDSDGEYFSQRTKDYAAKFPKPLALYYHGYIKQGLKQSEPFEIGECGRRWEDAAGRWIRVKLDANIPEAVKTWNDAKAGKARASSGSIAHLVRTEKDGHITHFPVVEVSVFDTSEGKQPANSYALAKPVAKARGFDVEEIAEDNSEILQAAAMVAAVVLQQR